MSKEGKILQFPGGDKDKPERSDREDSELEGLEFDSVLYEQKLTHMLLYLTALVESSGRPKASSMELRRVTLVDPVTNEELISWVSESTELDWQGYPTYYHAIFAEIKKRV